MSAEELKMVLETIQSLGANASSAAVWWIAIHYGVKVLGMAALLAGVCIAGFVIVRIVNLVAGANQTLTAACAMMGLDSSNYYWSLESCRGRFITQLQAAIQKSKPSKEG